MNITPATGFTNFQGLNFENVSELDRKHFIRNNYKHLKILAKKYDIVLESYGSKIPHLSSIDVVVKPLKENLSFFGRIFSPKGKSSYNIEYLKGDEPKNKDNFMQSVYNAIFDLKKQL